MSEIEETVLLGWARTPAAPSGSPTSSGGWEIDFSIWIEDAGRVDLQVKGGRYCLGEWFPEGPDGGGGIMDAQAT